LQNININGKKKECSTQTNDIEILEELQLLALNQKESGFVLTKTTYEV